MVLPTVMVTANVVGVDAKRRAAAGVVVAGAAAARAATVLVERDVLQALAVVSGGSRWWRRRCAVLGRAVLAGVGLGLLDRGLGRLHQLGDGVDALRGRLDGLDAVRDAVEQAVELARPVVQRRAR